MVWPAFSGVLVVEATKEIYALSSDVEKEPATLRLFPAGNLAAAAGLNAAARRIPEPGENAPERTVCRNPEPGRCCGDSTRGDAG
jgi:hypothetical protein